MDFKTILVETHKEYPIRIKSITPITDKMLDKLNTFLKKYRVIEIGKIKKTILQRNPLDFGGVDASEVFIIDATLDIPVSSYILSNELAALWNISQKQVVVRNQYEGMEQLTDQINMDQDIEEEAAKKKLVKGSLLSTDSNYMDHETPVPQELLAGDTYTSNFKDYLSKAEASRPSSMYPSNAGLFNWVKTFKPEKTDAYKSDFNKDIKDAPKIHPSSQAKVTAKPTDEEKAAKDIISCWGNIYTTKTKSKPYKEYKDVVKELEVALTTPALTKVRKKYKGKKNG